MTAPRLQSWTAIVEEVTRRIASGDWAPGALIPNEADLAAEFGCSRTTVNRALRDLADKGVLDRRRKAGTRVRDLPDSRARLDIPIVRKQVERRGAQHGYHLLHRDHSAPPPAIAAQLELEAGQKALHLTSLHTADGQPFVLEDRWISTLAVPDALQADFAACNANEWLVQNVPLSTGEIGLSAAPAGAEEAEVLGCAPGTALFRQDRLTRNAGMPVTAVTMLFAPGYRMRLDL
ncbi:UTRA domain-containing protein [Mesobacterium sp. TK19101]|uniref:UTRA domain-containing protein n=1 Tax=Mesobacterium hydrothermale TaxID=3111907 RepID=A0ABU6HH16_9RHOB|nr:UTRA domain-containing protein [Mesobacterium sp. TK19101]MEC3861749.1 UTRA domain-containing protein [Mesobacterium sp. TK19101]